METTIITRYLLGYFGVNGNYSSRVYIGIFGGCFGTMEQWIAFEGFQGFLMPQALLPSSYHRGRRMGLPDKAHSANKVYLQ